MNFESLLPSRDDVEMLNENVSILMGHILRTHMPFFTKYAAGLGRHIMHEHYQHMCTKSEVVSISLQMNTAESLRPRLIMAWLQCVYMYMYVLFTCTLQLPACTHMSIFTYAGASGEHFEK